MLDTKPISSGISVTETSGKRSHSCTGISLFNLADLHWMAVDCHDKLANDVVCSGSVSFAAHCRQTDQICMQDQVIHNGTCYSFTVATEKNQESMICKRSVHNKWLSQQSPWQHIVHAVYTLPPIYVAQSKCVVQFIKFGHRLEPFRKYWPKINSMYPFEVSTEQTHKLPVSLNVMNCGDKSYISLIALCDKQVDCNLGDTDENTSLCNPSGAKQISAVEISCPHLYFRTHSGNCLIHKFELKISHFDNHPIFNNSCSSEGHIYCNNGSTECWRIAEVCSYKLDQHGQLFPCSKGEHLQNCTKFECNRMHKCVMFYCVPFMYVCNGKWDCPDGTDEGVECRLPRSCEHLSRCKNSQKCIHLTEICDGVKNCYFKDDEFLCHMMSAMCPKTCQCLASSVLCSDSVIDPSHSLDKFFSVILLNSTFFRNSTLKGSLHDAGILHISHSEVSDISLLLQRKVNLLFLDCSWNNIQKVHDCSFEKESQTKIVKADNNKIDHVSRNAFQNVPSLIALNLSCNPLTYFSDDAIRQSSSICFISMKYIDLNDISHMMFKEISFDVFETQNFRLCCVIHNDTICTTQIPWSSSCSNLLLNTSIKVVFFVMSSLILLLNIVSIIFQVVVINKNRDDSNAFSRSVCVANVCAFASVVYLSFLWIADLVYTNDFVLNEETWRSSISCYAAFSIILWFSLAHPFLLLFISLSRLMVVYHPLSTKFKESRFVIKCMSALCLLGLVLSFSSTLGTWGETADAQLPNSLCSPLLTHSV